MGAGKWRKEYSDMLMGATVYIIADIDETGNNHANAVAKSLVGSADEIYLIDLATAQGENADPPQTELPQSYDISDYIEAIPQEQQKPAILGLIANATVYKDLMPIDFGKAVALLGGSGKPSNAEILLNLVENTGATFFHSEVKGLYACIPMENHTEIQPIESRDFELCLNGLFYKEMYKPISKDAVKQAIAAF